MSIAVIALPQDHSECFRKYCRLYYRTSLSISDHTASDINTGVSSSGDNIQASQVVLDALEHQLGNAQDTELTSEYKDFLKSERVEKYKDALKASGLNVEYYQYRDDDRDHPIGGKAQSYRTPQEILMEYSKVKDEERRLAHILKMKERRNSLHNLLMKQSGDLESTDSKILGELDVTTQKYLAHVRCSVQKFVGQYKNTIGSHSLLAGIGKMIMEQIELDDRICLWSFNSSVISESCFGNLQNQNGDSYMVDAVSVLTSFLIYSADHDLEANDEPDTEDFVTFYIHPMISNSFLKYILVEIPHSLDAKPTGHFRADKSDSDTSRAIIRTNIAGQFDESMYANILQWTNSFCEIL